MVTLEREAAGYLSGRRRVALRGSGYLPEGQGPPDRWKPQLELGLPGVRMARVAGPGFHPHGLQDRAFDPGRSVRLLPEPHNRHDPNAIGVWDDRLRLKAGYIPAKLSREVGRLLREGRLKVAISLWQWRDLDSGKRIGLHILLSVSDRVGVRRGGRWRRRATYSYSLPDLEIPDEGILA
jgi:HIRAN domain